MDTQRLLAFGIGTVGSFLSGSLGYTVFGSQKDQGSSNFKSGALATLASTGVALGTAIAVYFVAKPGNGAAAGLGLLDVQRSMGLLDVQRSMGAVDYGQPMGLMDVTRAAVNRPFGACYGCY